MKRKKLLNDSTHVLTDPNQNSQSVRGGGSKRNNRFNSVLEQVRDPNPDGEIDEPMRLEDIDEESGDSCEL